MVRDLDVSKLLPPWNESVPEALTSFASREGTLLSVDEIGRYSTERFVFGDYNRPQSERLISGFNGCPNLSIEFPDERFAKVLGRSIGLPIQHQRDYCKPQEVCFREAIAILETSDWVMSSIRWLVRSVHIIHAASSEFDTSHSSPEFPFTIFVSVPSGKGWPDAMRLAESVLHETMHLQLTLFESVVPLLNTSSGFATQTFSPWRNELRPPSGILHGLYVFRILLSFYKDIINDPLTMQPEFAVSRIYCIESQISQVSEFVDHPALSSDGRELVKLLLDSE